LAGKFLLVRGWISSKAFSRVPHFASKMAAGITQFLFCCAIVAKIQIKQVQKPSYFQNAGRDAPDPSKLFDHAPTGTHLPIFITIARPKQTCVSHLKVHSIYKTRFLTTSLREIYSYKWSTHVKSFYCKIIIHVDVAFSSLNVYMCVSGLNDIFSLRFCFIDLVYLLHWRFTFNSKKVMQSYSSIYTTRHIIINHYSITY